MMKSLTLLSITIVLSFLLITVKSFALQDHQKNRDLAVLLNAIDDGDIALVKLLVGEGIDINSKTAKGWTPLMEAIDNGEEKITEYLLSKNAMVNVANQRGYSPLFIAVSEGNVGIVNLLINYKADINYKSKNNDTALTIACQEGHLNIVELLLSNRAVINHNTVLQVAVSGGNMGIVKLMLAKGANVNSTSKKTHYCCTDKKVRAYTVHYPLWTPLFEAVHEDELAIAEVLLKMGANSNAVTDKITLQSKQQEAITGWLPIFEAIKNQNIQMLQLLLKNGASIDSKLNGKLTVFDYAKSVKDNSVLKVLQSHKS